jgi:hypothetical protein
MRWTRRRFMIVAASAAGVAVVGVAPGTGGAPAHGRPAPDLPIHGSPHLLATEMPSDPWSVPPSLQADPLVHFGLPPDLRDRMLLGIR